MDIFELFDPNTCDIRWAWSDTWTWNDYFHNKQEFSKKWINIVLVDMINHPIEDSIPISNEIFFDNIYPKNTVFCLYCHSWWSSWYIQKQLKKQLSDQYVFLNMEWWIWAYRIYKMNA